MRRSYEHTTTVVRQVRAGGREHGWYCLDGMQRQSSDAASYFASGNEARTPMNLIVFLICVTVGPSAVESFLSSSATS